MFRKKYSSPQKISSFSTFKDKLFNQALRFLTFRSRSEKEIRDYLRKKISAMEKEDTEEGGLLKELIEEVINKLKGLKFIDDETFTKNYVENSLKIRPRSLNFIKRELKMKGLEEGLLNQVFSNFSFADEERLAFEAVQKKLRIWEKLPREAKRKKMVSFLARRGFNWEIVRKIVDTLALKD